MDVSKRDSYKALFDYMKSKAMGYEAEISNQLGSYRKNQIYYSQREFQKSNMNELIQSIHNSHVSYLGDFHTHDQNSRNLVRIIKTFLKNKSKFIIGLEMVHEEHQEYLDAFLKGFLTELEFLESINYSESWRFPWSHYKILFNYARENEIPIIALNSKGTLEQRDKRAAERINHFIELNSSIPVLVLFGELHINANKLPRRVKELSQGIKIRQTIIHQNLDEPYWRIVDHDQSIEENKIIKFNNFEFCLFSSPPWMKYESMCYWYENLLGDPDFDIHEYIIEKGLKLFTENTYDNFDLIVKQLVDILKFHPGDSLEDFNVYDHQKINLIQEKIKSLKSKRLKEVYDYKLKYNKSFHIIGTNSLFCSNYSINRLSKLGGSFLLDLFLSDAQIDIDQLSLEDFFVFLLFDSLYSYLSAKSLNPFLKCDMYLDIELKLRTNEKNRTVLKATLDFMKDIKSYKDKIKKLSIIELVEVSTLIGEIFGEVLYNSSSEKKDEEYPFFLNVKDSLNYKSFIDFTEENILKDNLYKMRRKRFF